MALSAGHPWTGHAPVGTALLLVLVTLSSCGLADGWVRDAPPEQVPEAPVITARCPTDRPGAKVVDSLDLFFDVGSGSQPAGFEARGVLRCVVVDFTNVDADTVGYRIASEKGPFTPELAEAIRLSDQRFAGDRGACPTMAVAVPFVLITDGNNQAYRPRLPVNPCGELRPEVDQALAALRLARVDTYSIQRKIPG